ncbi:Putative essential protein Yae1 [Septoria linicola]|uniref:Protein YAE1 n=1 Tax=Septoria linicola TaxID=215465 RepID=A0A9Q9AJP4_9PEZI|nr:Putative essential protein Yae1 [Septoria linicola]
MLRDTLGRRASDNTEHTTLFMNGTTTESIDTASDPPQEVHSNDLNDDIFGSAPNSPVLSATAHQPEERVRRDHSDVPRLRSIHVTNGYREGIAVSKESHIQAGFDEGFSLGGEIGQKAGWILGVLEGITRGTKKGGREEVEKVFAGAQAELKIEALLGEEWFGMDGIWKYEVPGRREILRLRLWRRRIRC